MSKRPLLCYLVQKILINRNKRLKINIIKTQHQIQVLTALDELGQSLHHIEEKLNDLNPVKPGWLDNQDVCNLLYISKRTLESYREKGYLSFSRIRGKVLYSQSDIVRGIDFVLRSEAKQP